MSTFAIPVHVALIADPALVDPADLREVAAALNEQVQADFAPVWHVRATVGPYPAGGGYGTWNVKVVSEIDEPGALGYHSDKNGIPFALVDHDDAWAVTASHEVLEMLVDPFGFRQHGARLPVGVEKDYGRFGLRHASSRVSYLVEACDPCERATYEVGGVELSDFMLPDWYRTSPRPALAYSHLGTCAEPREVADGGYVSFSAPDGNWYQVFNTGGKLEYNALGKFDRAEHGSLRAFTDRAARAHRGF